MPLRPARQCRYPPAGVAGASDGPARDRAADRGNQKQRAPARRSMNPGVRKRAPAIIRKRPSSTWTTGGRPSLTASSVRRTTVKLCCEIIRTPVNAVATTSASGRPNTDPLPDLDEERQLQHRHGNEGQADNKAYHSPSFPCRAPYIVGHPGWLVPCNAVMFGKQRRRTATLGP